MIDSWQQVAISRNAMYLPCNECIKSRTALHRNTIIASLTAKLKKAHARVYVYFYKQLASRQGGKKYSVNTPRKEQDSRNITQRATAEHKTDRWGQTEYPNVIREE